MTNNKPKSGPVQAAFPVAAALLALTLLVFASSTRADENWTSYENGRFGYSLELPDIFDETIEPENGDGVEFKSVDGSHSLKVWGGHNVAGDDGNSLLEDCYNRVAHIVPGSERSGEGFYSIAYSDDGGRDGVEHIHHEYGAVNAETKAAFVLEYPKAEEARFSALIKRMEASLKIPDVGNETAEPPNLSAFQLKDGKVHKNGTALDCEINEVAEVEEGPIRFWSVFGPSAHETVRENETGVWFFSAEGACLTFVPLDSDLELQSVSFSPDGSRFMLARGGGVRPVVTFEIYGEGTEKVAEFSGIRDDFQWIDPVRFVLTQVGDDIREGGTFANLSYGLRLSVVMHDLATGETTALKEATDTANFSFRGLADNGTKASIVESSVRSEADWGDEDKIEERLFDMDLPAAG
ncbi:MAG: hypothetical protein LBJ64_05110 [Deltaproteobacteria bacterium]|jgi:hypothetical protein|nr:hypothetical protein [Deltaproteobacteria bacterium]